MPTQYVPICDFLEKFHLIPKREPVRTTGKSRRPPKVAPLRFVPIQLAPRQRVVLDMALTPNSNGKLPFQTVVYSATKKCMAA